MPPAHRETVALVMLMHAEAATRPRTRSAAQTCNAIRARIRDFLMHAPSHQVASGGAALTSAEFDETREPALRRMRANCQSCGLCGELRLTVP